MSSSTTATVPPTMRALYLPPSSDPSVSSLTLLSALTTPSLSSSSPSFSSYSLSDTDHLIRVSAVCPCKGELAWAVDFPEENEAGRIPVPCYDMAGVVVSSRGPDALAAGTPVYGYIDAGRTGCAAEYAVARRAELAVQPRNVGAEQAATLPIGALTAWQAFFVHGGLAPPLPHSSSVLSSSAPSPSAVRGEGAGKESPNALKRVIITGASGGVGVQAVQLAAAAGVGSIVAVCSGRNAALVRELGATDVVDYTRQGLDEWLAEEEAASGRSRKADVVLDTVGGEEMVGAAWRAAKAGGRMITVVAPVGEESRLRAEEKGAVEEGVTGSFFIIEPNGRQLEEITRLVEDERLRPLVDGVFAFEDFRTAFEKVYEGHSRGKVVIKVQQ